MQPGLAPFSPSDANVVIVCPDAATAQYRAPLLATCRVAVTQSADVAVQFLTRSQSALLIVDGDGDDGGVRLCEMARLTVPRRPMVLVTLSRPDAAAHLIDKCDSILLKPFAPNLLAARVGRLLRLQQRSREAREQSGRLAERFERNRTKGEHFAERRAAGTLIEWPNTHCPHCEHSPVVLFDYASIRRAWYACPACRKTWMAKRNE